MENEELELAALEAELAALEAEEAKPEPAPEPKPKPKKKKAPKVVAPIVEPEVKVVEVTPVRRAKLPRPLRQQGSNRQRGIRYRD
jgi:hypothetical protein